MNKFLFLGSIVSLSLVLFSCREERLSSEIPAENPVVNTVSKDTEMKTQFAKALAKALKEHKELRDFIKTEALKQVNRDYDVIYHVIKNKPVTTMTAMGGNTIHDLLLPYFETEAQLLEIENKLPLLTIFVPDLPEDSFSAESWETMDEIPYVAVRIRESNDIPIYGSDEENFVLDAPDIPAFPVVVIKNNERIVSDRESTFNNLDTPILTEPTDDVQLSLADNNFSTVIGPPPPPPPSGEYPRVDPYHVQAYDAYKEYTPGGWQRDFIYYGLTPTNTKGSINPTYTEELTSFKLTGPPQIAYTHISDGTDDAHLRPEFIGTDQQPPQASAWTDGGFEIRITYYTGAENSSADEMVRGFPVSPEDLFYITYTKKPFILGLYKYTPHIATSLMYDLYNNPENKVQFSIWDLNDFSNKWVLEFEEHDNQDKYYQEETHNYKYNANIELNPTLGVFEKLGLKFGASGEISSGVKNSVEHVDGNDDLGDKDVNFYDNVVDWGRVYDLLPIYGLVPHKYSNGYVEFEFRPRRTY
ncbi:MAG: hypothetical protein LBE36_11020 [Flavobacteriaceae bacterium]|jgi:hypothetical protein|nr:hypothetical protein [Flavobacteriaceae bacterium]